MTQDALRFIAHSLLSDRAHLETNFVEVADEDLNTELARYRADVLATRIAICKGLGVAVSARQDGRPADDDVKRSVLYFDDVVLPDPLFRLTEWTLERQSLPWDEKTLPRREIAAAVRHMQALAPLVKLGRVRFLPSTRPHEAPIRLKMQPIPKGASLAAAPDAQRWLHERAKVRKVFDDGARRMVSPDPPDSGTRSIHVDFGQLGSVSTYDHFNYVGKGEDGRYYAQHGPPPNPESLEAWLADSVTRASSDFIDSVLVDVGYAAALRCSLVTRCEVTAGLLDVLDMEDTKSDAKAPSVLDLELPMIDAASIDQLADLIDREKAAFDAFRYELSLKVDALARIEEPRERAEEAKKVVDALARDQVHEVERKMREARRDLRWDVPVTAVSLVGGALGFILAGPLGLIGGSLVLAGQVAPVVKKHLDPRSLPGYFLWKAGRGR